MAAANRQANILWLQADNEDGGEDIEIAAEDNPVNHNNNEVNHANNNNNVEDDEEEEEEDIVDNGPLHNPNGGIIEGGVAGCPTKEPILADTKKKSTDCDLYMMIECIEKLQQSSNAICSTAGAVVSIGFHDKTTKMSSVFRHFCQFCSLPNDPLRFEDVEFVHSEVLSHNETAEGCSIMKGDKIQVRLVRTRERLLTMTRAQDQKESDREYFRQLRNLFSESVNSLHIHFPVTSGGPNIVIECRPFLETGQRSVHNNLIKAHEHIVSKRCLWLKNKIAMAKETEFIRASLQQQQDEQRSFHHQGLVQIPDLLDGSSNGIPESRIEVARRVPSRPAAAAAADDDDDDAVMHYDPLERRQQVHPDNGGGLAHQIDDEDSMLNADDDRAAYIHNSMVLLPLKDHPPEAVKILLEYCYTNRVVGLGKEAFAQASKGAAVSPSSWPNQGLPSVSMAVSLAGIALAEEAGMSRLSLMCEIAASLSVTDSNVLDALAKCVEQAQKTGNRLLLLRKRAMRHLIHAPLLKTVNKKWMNKLVDLKDLLVPAILQGTLDVVSSSATPSKRKRAQLDPFYDQIDDEDKEARNIERLKSRTERQIRGPHNNFVWHHPGAIDCFTSSKNEVIGKKTNATIL